jgi:hypothetical protein
MNPLNRELGGGERLVLQARRDDAGVMRPVPARRRGCVDAEPQFDTAGRQQTGDSGRQQLGLDLVPERSRVDHPLAPGDVGLPRLVLRALAWFRLCAAGWPSPGRSWSRAPISVWVL